MAFSEGGFEGFEGPFVLAFQAFEGFLPFGAPPPPRPPPPSTLEAFEGFEGLEGLVEEGSREPAPMVQAIPLCVSARLAGTQGTLQSRDHSSATSLAMSASNFCFSTCLLLFGTFPMLHSLDTLLRRPSLRQTPIHSTSALLVLMMVKQFSDIVRFLNSFLSLRSRVVLSRQSVSATTFARFYTQTQATSPAAATSMRVSHLSSFHISSLGFPLPRQI